MALQELKFEELSIEQKLGLAAVSFTWDGRRELDAKNVDYLEQLVKNHSLSGIWVNPKFPHNDEVIKRLKEAAD